MENAPSVAPVERLVSPIVPYYDRDGITIYNADCLDVLPTIEAVDVVLTDPPYGTTQCKWDSVIDIEAMWKSVCRVCGVGPIVLCAAQPFASVLVSSRLELFRYDIIWDKVSATGHLNATRAPMRCHEHVLVFCSRQPTYNPQKRPRDDIYKRRLRPAAGRGDVSKQKGVYGEYRRDLQGNVDMDNTYPVSIVSVPNKGGWAKAKEVHPTQKPLELMAYLVATYSNPGEVILDFAMGSGTTLVAAKLLGRRAVGIEVSEEYCEAAVERLRQGVLDFGSEG